MNEEEIIKKSITFLHYYVEEIDYNVNNTSKHLEKEIDDFITEANRDGYNVTFSKVYSGELLKINIYKINMAVQFFSKEFTINKIKSNNRNNKIDNLIN